MNTNKIKTLLQQALDYINSNRLDNALLSLQEADRLSPNNIEVFHLLSVVYGMSANYEKSESYCKKALSINHKAVVVINNLGNAQRLLGKYDEAKKNFQNAINIQNDDIDAYVNLANLFIDIEKVDNADSTITTALNIDSNNLAVNIALGNLRLKQDRHTEAINIYKNILDTQPNNTDAIINLGQIYEHLGANDSALSYYNRALQLIPDYDQSLLGITSILEKRGDYTEALSIIKPAVEKSKNMKLHIMYARIYSRLRDYNEAKKVLTNAKDMVAIDQHKQELFYELGDVLDKLTHYDEAFTAYSKANLINRIKFDRQVTERDFFNIKKRYTASTLKNIENSGSHSSQPVFIIGMPRSGTSLVEQILSSHSKVFGGGELEYIDECIHSLEAKTNNTHYPENIKQLHAHDFTEAANDYIFKLKKLSADAPYITNKMPHNFLHLGLIQQLFPNAKIVHCLRNEKDTALSIYFHQFNINHPYASNLEDLYFYNQLYKDLMKHWKIESSLDIFTINYEDIIVNPEVSCRQLIDFFELEWEQDCLNFHNNKRLVNTPSYHQVKQPLYDSSVNRYLNYDKYMVNYK